MNNVEQAKITRNEGMEVFLNQNSNTYKSDVALNALVTKFAANKKAVTDIAALMGANNSGFNQNKADAKLDMGDFAATLSGSAQVKLDSLGKHDVSMQLHDAISYYTSPADAEAAARAQAAHDLMVANLTDLSPDYVKQEELDTFQTLINTFTGTQGVSQAVRTATPAVTTQFKSNIKLTDTNAKDLVKLGRKYKAGNKPFFDALVAVCKTPAVAVHHTNVDVTIKDSATNNPISGAIATLSNSKKTAASIDTGFLHFEQVSPGNANLTVNAIGYKPFSILIHINSGKDNSFNVAMETL
jgi:hypothetical protein